jgi:type II secretory pathway component GspD/PulD (secretin)
MDVQTKLGNIENRPLPKAVQDSAFATQERTAKTTVVVGDSDTVVIGGLMRDNISDTVAKIPLLGDIPILGWLFSAKSTTVEKTNLLIFLTPHIVRQYETVRKLLDKKLRDRDQFIEKNMGGSDPLRDERDDIIRNLPDMKELMSRKPQTTVSIDEDEQQQGGDSRPARPQTPFTGGSQNQ